MANQDLFKPSISLWQHYVTIISFGVMCLAFSFGSGWVATAVVITFLVAAAVEGCVDAHQVGDRP
ncbi:hypothetical protein ABFV57_10185 [Pseudomonas neuropathica]|uniref:hypothetical protein n=1 Tax=Pseudomonas neuropathica TaxID=2730425 RepID=UPI0034D54C35